MSLLSPLAFTALMASVAYLPVPACASPGAHQATLNLRTGQPNVWVKEFDAVEHGIGEPEVNALNLAVSRHWVAQARKGSQRCTWGEHWCMSADNRLTALSDGSLTLFDCCTGKAQVWRRQPGSSSHWHSSLNADTTLSRMGQHYLLKWVGTETDLLEKFDATDGRLLSQDRLDKNGKSLQTITYHWSRASELAPSEHVRPWRLQRMVHSGGSELTFVYGPAGYATRLLFNGQVVRSYRYNIAGWLIRADEDVPTHSPVTTLQEFFRRGAPQQYRYNVQGQLTGWPGGNLGSASLGTWGTLPKVTQRWNQNNTEHQAVSEVEGQHMTVTHTWASVGRPLTFRQPAHRQQLRFVRLKADQPWQQTSSRMICNGDEGGTSADVKRTIDVAYEPDTGKPLRWHLTRSDGVAGPIESPLEFKWSADGALRQLTVAGLRSIEFERDGKGRWVGVRHAWLRPPLTGAPNATLPPGFRMIYDQRHGHTVEVQLFDSNSKPGNGAKSRGFRVERDPRNPQKIVRSVPYGGASLLEFMRAYEEVLHIYSSDATENASDMAARECL